MLVIAYCVNFFFKSFYCECNLCIADPESPASNKGTSTRKPENSDTTNSKSGLEKSDKT